MPRPGRGYGRSYISYPSSSIQRMLHVHDLQSSMAGARNAVRTALRGVSAATMSLGIAGLLLNTACYTTNVRPVSELTPGEHVMVSVNATGREAVTSSLGDSVARAQGAFISNDVAGIHMSVTDVQFLSGTSAPRSGVVVSLPSAAFDSVATRKLSIPMTTWLVLGIAAGVVGLIKGINVSPSGNVDSGGKQPPPNGN